MESTFIKFTSAISSLWFTTAVLALQPLVGTELFAKKMCSLNTGLCAKKQANAQEKESVFIFGVEIYFATTIRKPLFYKKRIYIFMVGYTQKILASPNAIQQIEALNLAIQDEKLRRHDFREWVTPYVKAEIQWRNCASFARKTPPLAHY
jgi:hypothetical protein